VGLTSTLVRLAAGAPVRCFVIVGDGADEAAQWLRLDPALRVVDSPRSAEVLLVLGRFEDAAMSAVAAVHDSMAPPRAVVTWVPGSPAPAASTLAGAVSVDDPLEIGSAAVLTRDDLFAGRLASTPDILPDVDPAPWRGVGPFGQGGAGMTGGVPYGRPLAGRADDRDGLKLDQILVRVGPFLPPLPAGLELDVKIQGDVIQEVGLPSPPRSWPRGRADAWSRGRDLFIAALTQPVLVRELELARARRNLVWLAEFLRVCGLPAYGLRVLALARTLRPDGTNELERVARRLLRNRSLRWPTRKVGVLSAEQAQRLPGGPAARAAGIPVDARTQDPAYTRLGFSPVVATGSDAHARWRLHLDDARQALALANEAQSALTTPVGVVEGPFGPIGPAIPAAGAILVEMLPELLVGQEWGDAVMTVVSLDIDPAHAWTTASPVGGESA
jgi:hypothetical protein